VALKVLVVVFSLLALYQIATMPPLHAYMGQFYTTVVCGPLVWLDNFLRPTTRTIRSTLSFPHT